MKSKFQFNSQEERQCERDRERVRQDERLRERIIGRQTTVEEGRFGKNKRGSERLKGSKSEELVSMMKGDEQDKMSIQDLKHRKCKFSIIDNNTIKFIKTCLGGTVTGKTVLRGTQSLCATLACPQGENLNCFLQM